MSGELRIILLVLGLAVILAVFFYSRYERNKNKEGATGHISRTRGNDPLIRSGRPDRPGAPDSSSQGTNASALSPESDVTETPSSFEDGGVSPPPGATDETAVHPTNPPSSAAPYLKPDGGPDESDTATDATSVTDVTDATDIRDDHANEVKGHSGIGHKISQLITELTKVGQDTSPETEVATSPEAVRDDRILVLHICAPSERAFHGSEILSAADKIGLQRHDVNGRGAFERVFIDENGRRLVWFYVANMHEPGTFVWNDLPEERIYGLSVFARLPDNEEAMSLFDDMVGSARKMEALLEGASLLDENRSTLTGQTINHIREKIRDGKFRSSISRE